MIIVQGYVNANNTTECHHLYIKHSNTWLLAFSLRNVLHTIYRFASSVVAMLVMSGIYHPQPPPSLVLSWRKRSISTGQMIHLVSLRCRSSTRKGYNLPWKSAQNRRCATPASPLLNPMLPCNITQCWINKTYWVSEVSKRSTSCVSPALGIIAIPHCAWPQTNSDNYSHPVCSFSASLIYFIARFGEMYNSSIM